MSHIISTPIEIAIRVIGGMLLGPQAIKNLWARIGWKEADVDLYEINEAFAVVSLANNRLAGTAARLLPERASESFTRSTT